MQNDFENKQTNEQSSDAHRHESPRCFLWTSLWVWTSRNGCADMLLWHNDQSDKVLLTKFSVTLSNRRAKIQTQIRFAEKCCDHWHQIPATAATKWCPHWSWHVRQSSSATNNIWWIGQTQNLLKGHGASGAGAFSLFPRILSAPLLH